MDLDSSQAPSAELPLFLHWEKAVCWLLGKTAKFPKNVRFTFTVRIENVALEILEEIIAARYARARLVHLERISADLDKLRILLRLCDQLGHLDHRGYERAMLWIAEAGRMTGGWRRHELGLPGQGGEGSRRADARSRGRAVLASGGGEP